MKNFLAFLWFTSILALSANADTKGIPEIPVRHTIEKSAESLKIENVWNFEPLVDNFHRKRWAIKRDVMALGLGVDASAIGYGAKISGLEAKTQIFFRTEDKWFQNPEDFPCTQHSQSWFSTKAGTLYSAEYAADLWAKELSSRRLDLGFVLKKINFKDSEIARAASQEVYQEWLRGVEETWYSKLDSELSKREWAFYWKHFKKQCASHSSKKVAKKTVSRPIWRQIMDLPEKGKPKKLVSAPSRRWNGAYSVRLSLNVGGKKLNGQFLIDAEAPLSLVSPSFLVSQGIKPYQLQLYKNRPKKIRWNKGEQLAFPIRPSGMEISGYPLSLNELWMVETDSYVPPKYLSDCCDGVLGQDFLKLFAVEFSSGPPAHLVLWDRSGFTLGSNAQWVEMRQSPKGDLVSSCVVANSKLTASSSKLNQIAGVKWSTVKNLRLALHQPWQVLSKKRTGWSLVCDGIEVAKKIPLNTTRKSKTKIPGMTVGIDFLGRSSIVFDLAHGRLWFPEETIQTPFYRNQTGLKLKYEVVKGERVLRVDHIAPKKSAAVLIKEGLRPNIEIIQVNKRPAEDMDLWEVNQALAGAYGDTVILKWRDGDEKMYPLTVR